MSVCRVILASIIGLATVVTARAEGLCATKETVIFNCEFKNSVSSLCQSLEGGALIYRNGVDGRINLKISDGKNDVFFFSNTPYAGGGEAHIRFSRSGYTYYLYDKTVKGDEGPVFSAGIVIYKGGKKISSFACINDASIRAGAYQSISREKYRSIGAQ
ncbi:hypothetical protein ACV229_34950 [Burkholderia sp. MR1-5-21]